MNSIKSIKKSVQIILKNKIPLALLHCTNIYPTPPRLVRLNCIDELQKAFPKCTIGISDHTENIYTSLGAVARGARIIEKHFTLDKSNNTIRDHALSATPSEFRNLVILGREINKKILIGV